MEPLLHNPKQLNFPWPFPKDPSLIYRSKSYATISVVYFITKAIFCGFNKIIVRNKNTFVKLLEDPSKPLLTISNHRCNVDDPLVWSILNLREFYRNISRFRYTLAAHNICFTKPFHINLFSLGRCIPCIRGAGVFQIGVDYCIKMMSENNAWIHIFPEGKVTAEPIRIKWGISRLISESKIPPTLLPIWINGMENISPKKPPYYPKIGNKIEVIVGDPVDTNTILKLVKGNTELERRKEIADIVQDILFNSKNKK